MRTKISEAMLCRDCGNLVTGDLKCPLCDKLTEPHPDRGETTGYCQHCTYPFPTEKLTVVTWNEDPYKQDDDGDLFLLCDGCRAVQEEEQSPP